MSREVKYAVLPPGPTPKKLTARARIKHLLDHYLSFLSAHHKRGFAAEESQPEALDTTLPHWLNPRDITPEVVELVFHAGYRSSLVLKERQAVPPAPAFSYASLRESRNAAKSLIFSASPLSDAEYHARRVRMWNELRAWLKS